MTFSRLRERPPGPDLKPVAEVVSEKIWRAMTDASAWLRETSIDHALVGTLAVGAHGWPRVTTIVEFIVGESAWQRTGGMVTVRVGLPIQAHGVAIDTVSVRDDERHLLAAIEAAEVSEGVPVASIEALVYLKLASPRSQDRQDVFNLLRAGADLERIRRYLDANAQKLRGKLEEIVESMKDEE